MKNHTHICGAYLRLIPVVHVIAHICPVTVKYVYFARDFKRGMHAQQGDAAVDDLDSQVRDKLRYGASATQIDFTEFGCLPGYPVFIEYFP